MTENEKETQQNGDQTPVDAKALWPALTEIVTGKNIDVDKIKEQLEQGSDVVRMLNELATDERFLKTPGS